MSLTHLSSVRSAADHSPDGKARTSYPLCLSGGRESLHLLTNASIQSGAPCLRRCRHSEFRRSSGFMEASASAATDSTIRGLESDALHPMAFGKRQKSSRRQLLHGMLVMGGSSARSVRTFGRESKVDGSICVRPVDGLRNCRMRTKPNNRQPSGRSKPSHKAAAWRYAPRRLRGHFTPRLYPPQIVGDDVRSRTGTGAASQRLLTSAPTGTMQRPGLNRGVPAFKRPADRVS
jgi:hypothetical protein